MNEHYIRRTDSLYTIITTYPETLGIFTANGFSQLARPDQLESLGKMLSFEAAMKSKKKHAAIFMEMLNEVIEQHAGMQEEGVVSHHVDDTVQITGILPCPVKLPLLDSFRTYADSYRAAHGTAIDYELQAASGGLDWIEQRLSQASGPDDIPDLIVSAGFELFFDQDLVGRYRDRGVFKDLSGLSSFNSCFDGLDLKDPRGNYSIIAGVPAIFLVDTLELHGRDIPRTWDDLLSEQFTGSISLPVEDLDLFNAVCLTLYREKGIEAVRALGRNMLRSMHPSQMVARKGSEAKPAVTVLPWFFTHMIFSGTSLKVVWPEDGSILSPIFLAAKAEKADKLSEIVHYFESRPVAQLMREKGFFPCVNPEIDNGIPSDHRFKWLGWEYIYAHDMTSLIARCTEAFNEETGARS